MTAEPVTTKEEKEHRFRMSQFNLQNTSVADQLGTSSGHLKVEKAVDALLETRESNKLLTKVIIGLIVYSILLTAAIFGVSIAAFEMAKDTTIDPSTGLVHVKQGQDGPIMRTAEAIVFNKRNSIHGMSNEGLADLLSVSLQDGAAKFQVKGYGRTEAKTMLLVDGGVLTFDETGLVDVTGDLPNLVVEPFRREGEGRKLSGLKSEVEMKASNLPQPEGGKCVDHFQCKSELCLNKLCKASHSLADGEQCDVNQACQSGFCSSVLLCGAQPDLMADGETCFTSNACESEYCNSVFQCGLMADGESCLTDNDCKSENCNLLNNCGELDTGGSCLCDSHCKSGRCNNLFYCAEKFERDARCWNDGDCKSNDCESYWTGYHCA